MSKESLINTTNTGLPWNITLTPYTSAENCKIPITTKSNKSALRVFLGVKIISVINGPKVTSTPNIINSTSLAPAEEKNGGAYQSANIKVNVTKAMATLMLRWAGAWHSPWHARRARPGPAIAPAMPAGPG